MAKGLPRSLANFKTLRDVSPKQFRHVLRSFPVTVTATSTAVGFGTAVFADLPEGNLILHAATCKLGFTTSDTDVGATWNGDFSIGTDPDANGTLATTEVNIIASTAIGPAVSRTIAATRANNTTPAVLDNTGGGMELNFNLLVDAADIADDSSAIILVTGYLDLVMTVLGDD